MLPWGLQFKRILPMTLGLEGIAAPVIYVRRTDAQSG